MVATYETVRYVPRGPIRDLFTERGRAWHVGHRFSEVLIEGPAGTGKSFGVAQWMHQLCLEGPPNLRVLWARQTLQSHRESTQVTFEKVCGDDEEMLAYLTRGAKRENRRSYDYPGGQHIALGGLDHPERLYSTEWDVVWIEEAVEVARSDYLRFHRALRNNAMRWHLLLSTTNPKSQYHWLNRRFPEGHRRAPDTRGRLLRLLSRHKDNPTCTPEYLRGLEPLPEPLRSQLYLGAWVSASGLVFPQYDEGRHLVNWELRRTEDGRGWLLVDPSLYGADTQASTRHVKWFGASMDFGYSNPGCFGVWAVLADGSSVLVREVYRTGWQQEQWAEAIEEIHRETPISRIIGDCAEPRFIDFLNDSLSFSRGRGVGSVVRACDKSKGKIHGLNAVRRALDNDLIRFLHPEARMRQWPDPELDESAPTCSTQEAPSYTYPDPERAGTPDARVKREQSEVADPTCVDHGMDMWEYWATAMYGDRNLNMERTIKPDPPQEGTAAWALDLPDSGRWR